MKTVTVTIENHIAQVTLSRPEQSNSLIFDTFKDLTEAANQLAENNTVRVIVLTGAGKHFCAGLDRSLFPQKPGTVDWFEEHVFNELDELAANLFQRCVTAWQQIPIPVIAAVNGAALGGGCQVALGADIRIADATTKMSLMETHWGLIPDMAVSLTLPPLMPKDVAAEILLSARILDAQEAKATGLVTQLTDDCYASAMALAKNIAAKSPEAIRATKKLYQAAWGEPKPELLRLEAQLQRSLLGTSNQVESVRANLEKRQPVFNE
ncbi:MAG: crotonase/enoyl-CoA hydratase family protein [Porticoccaceae bacterium]|nr:crotonase/enoyl-CoA hydratase family protein [Pseudomonadales bacterium]MCP5172395.1 crotonase/enoyl-CoA hydratase family protein [Pseudomonadales bacterium]